jgi:hypothetical protein
MSNPTRHVVKKSQPRYEYEKGPSKLHKMNCKNSTQTAVHLEQASKIHVSPNCKVKLQKHTILFSNI